MLNPTVTITFEKRSRSFERLLLAPISLEMLMLAKTSGAIIFGVVNAFIPIIIAAFLADPSGIAWSLVIPAIIHRYCINLPRAFHRSLGKRDLRSSDLFQLLPFSDDLPVRTVLSHHVTTRIYPSAFLYTAYNLRCRYSPRGGQWRAYHVLIARLLSSRGVLYWSICTEPL